MAVKITYDHVLLYKRFKNIKKYTHLQTSEAPETEWHGTEWALYQLLQSNTVGLQAFCPQNTDI